MIPINILGHITNKETGASTVVFKSISAVATTFAITHTGTDDPIWSDGTDTYQPVKVGNVSTVTFTNWSDATEKTVTITVNNYSEITGLSETEFINKGLTYMDLSLCTGYVGGIILNTNANLTTLIVPTTTSRLGVFSYFDVDNCDLGSLDLSPMYGFDRARIQIGNNSNLTSFTPPQNFDLIEDFSLTGSDLITSLDISTLNQDAIGTKSLNFSSNALLSTVTFPSVYQGNTLNNVGTAANAALPSVSGTIDLSYLGLVKQIYLNKDNSTNYPNNTACTSIVLPGSCDTWFYMGNFDNATVDATGFTMNALICRIEDMNSVTALAWSTNNPTSSTSNSSNYIRNMSSLTGTLDLSWYRVTGGLTVTNCPNVTGITCPAGTSGVYGNITFTGFNTGFYIDFTGWPQVVKHASRTINVSDNNMTSEQVNHILVDLAAHVASEAEGGDLTGRTLTIDGTNGCVDQTSGGYNGYEALLELVSKGYTVNATLCPEVLVFKTTRSVSTTLSLAYSGTGTPSWTDGTDTYTGTSVTFANWSDATEKTVTITVDENDKLTSLTPFAWDNIDLTYFSLLAASEIGGAVTLNSNASLSTYLHPPSTNDITTLYLQDTNVSGTFDLRPYTKIVYLFIQSSGITDFIYPTSPLAGSGIELRISPPNNSNTIFTGDVDYTKLWTSWGGGSLYQYHSLPNATGISLIGASTTSIPRMIDLHDNNFSISLDFTEFTNGIEAIRLDGSDYTGFTLASGSILGNSSLDDLFFYNMNNVTALDFSAATGGMQGELRAYSSNLTSITFPTFTAPTPSNLSDIWLYSNSLGYIDFTVITNITYLDNQDIQLQNNGMTAAEVNHILVDLDTDANSSYTGRSINIGGTNAAPDSSSGGYDGSAAVTSLVSKGFTVTHS